MALDPTAIVSIYSGLNNMTFTGTYEGEYMNTETGSTRYLVDVSKTDPAAALIQQTRHGLQGLAIGVWKGWTDRADSYMGYNWPVRIFAPAHPGGDGTLQIYRITHITVFSMSTPAYRAGVNIHVAAQQPVQPIDQLSST